MTAEKILLSPRENAVLERVPVPTLARWRRAGTGPPWYALTPRTVRYDPGDLDAWPTMTACADHSGNPCPP